MLIRKRVRFLGVLLLAASLIGANAHARRANFGFFDPRALERSDEVAQCGGPGGFLALTMTMAQWRSMQLDHAHPYSWWFLKRDEYIAEYLPLLDARYLLAWIDLLGDLRKSARFGSLEQVRRSESLAIAAYYARLGIPGLPVHCGLGQCDTRAASQVAAAMYFPVSESMSAFSRFYLDPDRRARISNVIGRMSQEDAADYLLRSIRAALPNVSASDFVPRAIDTDPPTIDFSPREFDHAAPADFASFFGTHEQERFLGAASAEDFIQWENPRNSVHGDGLIWAARWHLYLIGRFYPMDREFDSMRYSPCHAFAGARTAFMLWMH